MKRVVLAALVAAMLIGVAGGVDAKSSRNDDDDYPKNRVIVGPNGDTQVVRQKHPDQRTAVGTDGTVYQITPGGLIDTRTGQFIPK